MSPDLNRIEVTSAQDVWDWLEIHHADSQSYLLVTWKASCPEKYVSRDLVLDALLAYGWIDGRRYALDENRTMQLICQRQQQKWTASYRARIEALTAKGLLQPSGLRRVAEAQEKGTWLVNEDVDQLICPDDLKHALMTHHAYDWWQAAAPSYRRNILRWLGSAKQPQTRDKRIEEIKTASMAGKKIKNM